LVWVEGAGGAEGTVGVGSPGSEGSAGAPASKDSMKLAIILAGPGGGSTPVTDLIEDSNISSGSDRDLVRTLSFGGKLTNALVISSGLGS